MVASALTQTNQTHTLDTTSSGARKRRRQILQSKKATDGVSTMPLNEAKKICTEKFHPALVASSSATIAIPTSSDLSNNNQTKSTLAPRKISHCDSIAPPVNADCIKTAKGKRPQMRYEPDVPMTKEEAAVWRREQRRKRNRESAAASRQRQRDRITELEKEVDDWKIKFQNAINRLQDLEKLYGHTPTDIASLCSSMPRTQVNKEAEPEPVSSSTTIPQHTISVSPCPSPELHMSSCSEMSSDTSQSSCASYGQENIAMDNLCGAAPMDNTEQHLKEKNSLPAVKITGAYQQPSMSSNTEIVPDQCSSMSNATIMATESVQISAPVSPSTRKSECLEDIQRLTDQELEFDEFLMDAADWL